MCVCVVCVIVIVRVRVAINGGACSLSQPVLSGSGFTPVTDFVDIAGYPVVEGHPTHAPKVPPPITRKHPARVKVRRAALLPRRRLQSLTARTVGQVTMTSDVIIAPITSKYKCVRAAVRLRRVSLRAHRSVLFVLQLVYRWPDAAMVCPDSSHGDAAGTSSGGSTSARRVRALQLGVVPAYSHDERCCCCCCCCLFRVFRAV
jgi:hypothetical protein